MLRFRNDKSNGNHFSVVEKVIHSIQDGVSEQELIKACPEISNAWKTRARDRAQQAKKPPAGLGHVKREHEHQPSQPSKRPKVGERPIENEQENDNDQQRDHLPDIPTYEDSDED